MTDAEAFDCKVLYKPDPDIAGRGVIISFVAHAACYIFIGMLIAPCIHMFFRQVSIPRRPAAEDGGDLSQKLLISRGRHAIVESYGSQYIVGLAFMVVAIIKQAEISYYHLRIVHALASINLAAGCVSGYNDIAIADHEAEDYNPDSSYRQPRLRGPMFALFPRQWKIPTLAFYLCTYFYLGISIFIGIRGKDNPDFFKCYRRGWYTFGVSMGLFFFGTITAGMLRKSAKAAIIGWVWVTALVCAIVAFQTFHIYDIIRTFQDHSSSMKEETEFGFGQLMVFFMIFQLIVEYGVGLREDFATLADAVQESDPQQLRNQSPILSQVIVWAHVLSVVVLPSRLLKELSGVRVSVRAFFRSIWRTIRWPRGRPRRTDTLAMESHGTRRSEETRESVETELQDLTHQGRSTARADDGEGVLSRRSTTNLNAPKSAPESSASSWLGEGRAFLQEPDPAHITPSSSSSRHDHRL